MMCASVAGQSGKRVLLIDHAKKLGEKIRISGGGRCNFTNLHASPQNYLSENPRFCVSALKRYTQHDFIRLVEKHGIKYHEKTLGQLFCDDSAKQIIQMLLDECAAAKVQMRLGTKVESVYKKESGFEVVTEHQTYTAQNLVIATGGLSIPKLGATHFGYRIAKQFGLELVPTRAGLVPLTFDEETLAGLKPLSGVSVDAIVRHQKTKFREGLLFTHRGLSGPSILQISSYVGDGENVVVNMVPDENMFEMLKRLRDENPKQEMPTVLSKFLPKRLAGSVCEELSLKGNLADQSNKVLQKIGARLNDWHVLPNGSEGYRTAEVTLGGVSTDELSSKTMEASKVPGLYFIGEVVDVTGHLGGFNFQWAWSSAVAAGRAIAA